jgi:hypothetical protein
MSDNISLLPENLRKKEEELKTSQQTSEIHSDLKFSIPSEEREDIEVIEVDEGEIDKVLAGEPWLSRMAFQTTNFIEGLKHKLFEPNEPPPPPKLPPQFFVPPESKPITQSSSEQSHTVIEASVNISSDGTQKKDTTGKSAVRITPTGTEQRRIRVIRRVRKPVRVSFVTEEDARIAQIDVSKRKFTLLTTLLFCVCLLGGGFVLLKMQVQKAQEYFDVAKSNTAQTLKTIDEKQKIWAVFQNLEPKLKVLSTILDQHIIPTNVLAIIEENTLPTVYYRSFSMSGDGKVGLQVTADSIETAIEQIAIYKKSKFIKKVDASGYALQYDGAMNKPSALTYNIGLTLTDDALHPREILGSK